jgi:hypothetical protein
MKRGRTPFDAVREDDVLSQYDVSYDKLVELQQRLCDRTRAGKVEWEVYGDRFQYTAKVGVVDVTSEHVSIYNDSGVRLRRFRPDSNDLYRAIKEWKEKLAQDVISAIMADLDALGSP